ncbi:Ribosome production factor 1 [Saguinus oedipus]|uniref:Ribosome production factor 1 n=1 Tax=Saguinus oedipus TaxID=9490 RepID=A0ABQ9VDY1_SAGOE|nr:Ribosome production factor 1 [Saguinus oedipus]
MVAYDEATDEFASYFNKQTSPKILITTSDRPHGRTVRLCEQLSTVIPNSHVYYRRGLALKKIIPQCITRDFTDLIVINEDRKTPIKKQLPITLRLLVTLLRNESVMTE